jgi:choline-glycine betaine transporter
MKNLHYGHCVGGVALAIVLLVALGVKASTLGLLAVVLACPLMMFVMMRMMMGEHSGAAHRDDQPVGHGRKR